MQKKCLLSEDFTYTSGSEKDTDAASIQVSHPYYFDIPAYMRLSETGYRQPFNNYLYENRRK